ncbi:unnamed protein product, partial [Rotaria magnacalcarata]
MDTAAILTNGKVLVAGGYGNTDYLNTAELYDPSTGIWTMTGSMSIPLYLQAASVL